MPYLPFVSDEDFRMYATELVNAAKNAEAKVTANPYKNVIDPFSALTDAARQDISLDEWMIQEESRQIQKSFQNAVGDFHQHILGAIPGWRDAGEAGSFDVINEEKKIIAEVKNKHNTMNAGAERQVYSTLANWLDYGKEGYTAYVVDIVPKRPGAYEYPFTPSERKIRKAVRTNLLRTDGRSFYALATGYDNAIDMLYEALAKMLAEILNVDNSTLIGGDDFRLLFEKAYLKK